MPIENPTPEQLEAIRADGLCKKTGAVAQWGYHDKSKPKLFLLAKGEKLPEGWSETPSPKNPPKGDAG